MVCPFAKKTATVTSRGFWCINVLVDPDQPQSSTVAVILDLLVVVFNVLSESCGKLRFERVDNFLFFTIFKTRPAVVATAINTVQCTFA
jgi:hypothetical protein